MQKHIQHPMIWLLAILFVLLLAACGDPQAAPTATPIPPTATPIPPTATPILPTATPLPPTATSPPPTVTPAPPTATPADAEGEAEVEEGQALFAAKGCAACHGADAEGVEGLGLALAGHSREAVFKQVRTPRQVPPPGVQMPAFGPDRISDEELEKITAFILSLGPPMGAGAFAGSMVEAAHLRLAAAVLEAEDVADAKAHLQDLMASAEGETREKAEEILDLLEKGELHEAEHEIESMLLQALGIEWTAVQLHLILALDALQRHDDVDAAVHLEDAVNLATEDEKTRIEGLLADLKAGKAHDVEHELEEMLEQVK